MLSWSSSLFAPGPGRSLYLVEEVEVGYGRPDLLALVASPAALQTAIASGVRVPTRSAAHLLGDPASTGGLDASYARTMRRRLEAAGWSAAKVSQFAGVVHRSVAVEIKVKDWRRALDQAAKLQRTAGEVVIAAPTAVATRIPAAVGDRYGFGLLAIQEKHPVWLRQPRAQNLSIGGRVWLTELLLRAYESDSIQRPSSRTKFERASRIEAILRP